MTKAKPRRPSTRGDRRSPSNVALEDLLETAPEVGRRAPSELDDDAGKTAIRAPRPVARERASSDSRDDALAETFDTALPAPEDPALAGPVLTALRVAICEEGEHVAAATAAIARAGHTVAIEAGAGKVADAIRAGDVDVLLVGMPGGDGLVAATRALEPNRPVVIAAYAGRAIAATAHAARDGADLVALRPHDAERLAPVLLAAERLHRERHSAQVARGEALVLRAKLDEIADPELRGLQPFEAFQRVMELELKRARRFEYPLSVALFVLDVPAPPAGLRGILRARAASALVHAIRDIDLATQLDGERFLVLLPYTELDGAAKLGRRVIAAVAGGEPVVAGGQTYAPRVVGAVAQQKTGEPLSFAKLMKDATRALEQARRDGAELAVEP